MDYQCIIHVHESKCAHKCLQKKKNKVILIFGYNDSYALNNLYLYSVFTCICYIILINEVMYLHNEPYSQVPDNTRTHVKLAFTRVN